MIDSSGKFNPTLLIRKIERKHECTLEELEEGLKKKTKHCHARLCVYKK